MGCGLWAVTFKYCCLVALLDTILYSSRVGCRAFLGDPWGGLWGCGSLRMLGISKPQSISLIHHVAIAAVLNSGSVGGELWESHGLQCGLTSVWW
jgi:hypothetical protein